MPIELVWKKEIEEGFDVEEFASGLLDTAIDNLKTDGYVQSAVWFVSSNELYMLLRCFFGI